MACSGTGLLFFMYYNYKIIPQRNLKAPWGGGLTLWETLAIRDVISSLLGCTDFIGSQSVTLNNRTLVFNHSEPSGKCLYHLL
jgi:hypothetical protein